MTSTIVSNIEKPIYQRFKDRWECLAQGEGYQFRIVLQNKRDKNQFEPHRLAALAMLGSWSIESSELVWFPLAVLTADKTIALPQG